MSDVVRTRREGAVIEVTLDRPKANAIDLATSRIMGATFKAFRDDAELRVAIVTGAGGKFFSAGWDLKAAAGGDAVDGDYGVGGFGGMQELPDLNKPTIAAVNGMAVGGGFELALSCDLILASSAARFALPEIHAGTIADAASIKLPRRMPYHVAMELLLTGRWMDAGAARPVAARTSSMRGFKRGQGACGVRIPVLARFEAFMGIRTPHVISTDSASRYSPIHANCAFILPIPNRQGPFAQDQRSHERSTLGVAQKGQARSLPLLGSDDR